MQQSTKTGMGYGIVLAIAAEYVLGRLGISGLASLIIILLLAGWLIFNR